MFTRTLSSKSDEDTIIYIPNNSTLYKTSKNMTFFSIFFLFRNCCRETNVQHCSQINFYAVCTMLAQRKNPHWDKMEREKRRTHKKCIYLSIKIKIEFSFLITICERGNGET